MSMTSKKGKQHSPGLNKTNAIVIYTDGSCNNKTGIGGVGIVMLHKDDVFEYSKGYEGTTSARMEIQAVITALTLVEDLTAHVLIYCDNQYVVNAWKDKWVLNWERYSFVNRKNSDLWRRFLSIVRERKGMVVLKWVRGHNDDPGNEIADMLARGAYLKKAKKNIT